MGRQRKRTPAQLFQQSVGKLTGTILTGLGGPCFKHSQIALERDGVRIGQVIRYDILSVGIGQRTSG